MILHKKAAFVQVVFFAVVIRVLHPELHLQLAISELRRKLVTNNDAHCILGPFCATLRQLSCVYRSYHGKV